MSLAHPRCSASPSPPPDLLGEDGAARPVVKVEELNMPIGELRCDQVDDDVECDGQLRVRAGDKVHDLS